ncbi:threonine-phosphate decarboxylase [Thiohalocapsa marina]|uniref:threonine-phosphate decarboxylase n=1 Tax=Thiohalocapsa marina TaxID=424902 RepID=A0A5M8FVA9_9GAMM|nr:threonine-phosphate decarboxylase CobD [Thiohalocapsa marina]KAA6187771.1 threonine-phosphate decarboxylase [Thiohalocapsa marina]
MTERHGGNLDALARRAGRPAAEILDFSANINPLGPPPALAALFDIDLAALGHYPDPDSSELRSLLAEAHDIDPERLLVGNGSEQLIWWLPRALRARRLLLPVPSYLDYGIAAAVWGLPIEPVQLCAETGFALDLAALDRQARPGDLVWIGQPNNPTGRLVDPAALMALVSTHPEVFWAIDEAFMDFVEGTPSALTWSLPNLAVMRSMTKFQALAGLRLGFGALAPERRRALQDCLPEWSVNTLAQRAGILTLRASDTPNWAERSRRLVREQRQWLSAELATLGLQVFPGSANYLLCCLPEQGMRAAELQDRLLREQGIAIRDCSNYQGLGDRYIRVAVRDEADNGRLLAGLNAVFNP